MNKFYLTLSLTVFFRVKKIFLKKKKKKKKKKKILLIEILHCRSHAWDKESKILTN